MSTTIPCRVDTTPMADKINTVSHNVARTTQAVVAMESAVILAEKKSADKVCSNVNRGFFTMIQSQISQKIASHYSRVEALVMHLKQQQRQLRGIKNNMEKEYVRISERYFKIFTNINKELERRIKELDRPVFDLVNRHMVAATNRMHALAGWAAPIQEEGLTNSQVFLMSNLKQDAKKAIEESHSFLHHIALQRKLTDKILISNPYGNEDHPCEVPVAIYESQGIGGIPVTNIMVCQGVTRNVAQRVSDVVNRTESLPWKEGQEAKPVDEEFHKLLQSSSSSLRVKEMIQKIYVSNKYETL